MIQKWYQSPVVLYTIIVQVAGVLSMLGFWEWIGVSSDLGPKIAGAIATLISYIVAARNNPTNPTGWGANTPPAESGGES
jgi:hypothetical protein